MTGEVGGDQPARPRIGLVLGGGGARGIAHIGVLDVLEREGVPIDLIVGTSMGAIVGALYAAGVKPATLTEQIAQMQGRRIFATHLFSARSRQRAIALQLAPVLGSKAFADLRIPVIVMAVDVLTGREVALNQGAVLPAVLASSAVPAVFPTVEIDGMQLADGGVIDSLATHVAYGAGAERVIAVDVYPPLEQDNPWVDPLSAVMGFQLPQHPFSNTTWARMPSMLSSMWRAFRVLVWHLHEQRLASHPPHVLLRPDVQNYASLDFKDIRGPLEAGRTAAEQHLAAIRQLIGR